MTKTLVLALALGLSCACASEKAPPPPPPAPAPAPVPAPAPAPAPAPKPVDPMVAAQALFDAQKYKEAAEAFRAITQKDPKNAKAWFELGYSLHSIGQIDEAIPAHEKAAEFPDYRAAALYNLGCAHALKGNPDKAFEALNASIDSGFNQLQVLQNDPDLKSLREDPRYALLVARLSPAKV